MCLLWGWGGWCRLPWGENQCFWMAVPVPVPVNRKFDLLRGLMWLHALKKNIISKWHQMQHCSWSMGHYVAVLCSARGLLFRCSSRSLSCLKPFWADTCNCLEDRFSFSVMFPALCLTAGKRSVTSGAGTVPAIRLRWIEPRLTELVPAGAGSDHRLHFIKISM